MESGGRRSFSGVQGQSLGRGLGDPDPEAEAVCRHCLQILTTEAIKI